MTNEGYALRGANKTVVYRAFALGTGNRSDTLYAKESENCSFKEGRIERGAGLLALSGPYGAAKEISQSYVKRLAILPYRVGTKKYSEFTAFATLTGVYFYDYAEGVYKLVYEGEDAQGFEPCRNEEGEVSVVLIDATGARAADKNGNLTDLVTGRSVDAVCFFGERTFLASEPYTVFYSATFAPTDFATDEAEGGRIELVSEQGEIHSLVRLGEYLYAFREREITRIAGKASALEFVAKNIPVTGGRIFKGSVGACGDKIFFLAEEGLFSFDGRKAVRILENMRISPRRGEQVCVHAVSGGTYYLQYADENNEWRSVVVERGGEHGYYSFYKEALSSSGGKALCLYGQKIYELDERGSLPIEASAYFEAETDFGLHGEKALKGLTIKGSGKVAVTVKGERAQRRRIVEISSGKVNLFVGMKGERYTLRFEPYKGAKITEIAATLYAFQK